MWRVVVSVLVVGVSMTGCGNDSSSGPPTGESLYQRHCASCHGGSARGASAPPLVGDGATPYSDAELATIIADGIGSMPGFSDRLDDAEIDMVIDHLRSLDAES